MIRTVTALINELGKIRDRLTSSDIPVSVDGKEIISVELVADGGYKAVIKTDFLIDERLNDRLMEFLRTNPTQELHKISGKAHDFSRGMKAPQCFF